jgi:hypothetical protein
MLFAIRVHYRLGDDQWLRLAPRKPGGHYTCTEDVRQARKFSTMGDLTVFAEDLRLKNYEAVAVTPEMMEASSS